MKIRASVRKICEKCRLIRRRGRIIGVVLGKIKERTCSSSVKNSSNNPEPNLRKKVRTVLLCLRAKVLAHESRSIYL